MRVLAQEAFLIPSELSLSLSFSFSRKISGDVQICSDSGGIVQEAAVSLNALIAHRNRWTARLKEWAL